VSTCHGSLESGLPPLFDEPSHDHVARTARLRRAPKPEIGHFVFWARRANGTQIAKSGSAVHRRIRRRTRWPRCGANDPKRETCSWSGNFDPPSLRGAAPTLPVPPSEERTRFGVEATPECVCVDFGANRSAANASKRGENIFRFFKMAAVTLTLGSNRGHIRIPRVELRGGARSLLGWRAGKGAENGRQKVQKAAAGRKLIRALIGPPGFS
jgi:hypothetical protein